MDLVNQVQGASRHKPTLFGIQGTARCKPLCKGSRHFKALQVGLGGINDISWGHYKSMLASMTISSVIFPFVIDDNKSCSPCEHAPLLSSSLPLWHQWKRVSTYLYLKSLITAHWYFLPLSTCTILGPVCMPGVTILSPFSFVPFYMNKKNMT